DKVSLADLVKKYQELVDLARKRRISPDMQAGGIATVSNFGTFGIEWGTPIPLPDQTLLLGLGAGKKTPSWNESKKEFVPQTEAQITTEFSSRSEEHTSELQSPDHLVCRLLLEKKKQNNIK